jgi:C-methyltransferase
MSVRGTADSNDRGQHVRERVLELSRAYILSRAIHVAAELGVADHVGDAPVPVIELARQTGTDPGHIERLLRLLAAHHIFTEVRPGEFAATPGSAVLREDAPDSLRPTLRMVTAPWWSAVGALGHTVKTGATAFEFLHGQTFFSYLQDHHDDQLRFDAGMAANSVRSDDAIACAYDFSHASVVLDVGGGRGGLLWAIGQHYPHLRAILFDQPQVVESSPLIAAAANERYAGIGGDFFQEVPSGADIYLLKGVLHDFDDDQSVSLLGNCRRAMSRHSRLLIAERQLAPDDQPHEAKIIDILMMALLGGRERSLDELKTLLAACDLKLMRQFPTSSEFTISECAPAQQTGG